MRKNSFAIKMLESAEIRGRIDLLEVLKKMLTKLIIEDKKELKKLGKRLDSFVKNKGVNKCDQ